MSEPLDCLAVGDRRRRRRRRPLPSSVGHDSDQGGSIAGKGDSDATLDGALTPEKARRIDRLLRSSSRDYNRAEGSPPHLAEEAEDVLSPAASQDESDDGDRGEDDAAPPSGAANRRPSREDPPPPPPMTDDERAEVHADVFGRPPPDVARFERRLLEVMNEVGKLPEAERGALTEVIRTHPMLIVNCPHVKMMLDVDRNDGDGDGDGERSHFDASSAARRLSRYWQSRRSLLGDRAGGEESESESESSWRSPEALAGSSPLDYGRYYKLIARAVAVSDDPEEDAASAAAIGGEMSWGLAAERTLRTIHACKVEALDALLEEMDAGAAEIQDGASAEEFIDASARTMAMDSSDEWKLQFLRVENMDEARAAWRLLRYWKTGLRLFGLDFEHNPSVDLDDIEDCSGILRRHQLCLLPGEDASGRSVFLFREATGDRLTDNSLTSTSGEETTGDTTSDDHFRYGRVFWYMLHVAMERESCLRNGLVAVADLRKRNDRFSDQHRQRRAVFEVESCIPAKICARHILFGPDFPWWQRQVLRGIAWVIGASSSRSRFVVHGGTPEEMVSSLAVFGIGAEMLPTDLGGAVDAEEHFSRWLEERKAAGL